MQVAIVNSKRKMYQQVVDSTTYVPFFIQSSFVFPMQQVVEQVN